MQETETRLWSSRLIFIFAASGAAVGLGNIWKFPYVAGANGGGAFVLVYLLCILGIGLPILMAEFVLGRRGGKNPFTTFAKLATDSKRSKYWRWAGLWVVAAGFIILSYYGVIAGWTLSYSIKAMTGQFKGQDGPALEQLFASFSHNTVQVVLYQTLVMLVTGFVVALGVRRGIEKALYILFPSMLVLLLVLVGYAIDTGYFAHGLSFLFHPDFSQLTHAGFLVALGHAFFTLSLATGSMMIYGAYVPASVSLVSATMLVVGLDTLIAILAGLAIFPLVFAHGLHPGAGPGLIFQTMPLAFGHMHYGSFLGSVFFIMLLFAALTSAISLLEPSVAWASECFNMSRKKAVVIVTVACWLLGLCTVFSFNIWSNVTLFGHTIFDSLDYLTANIMLPVGGLFIAVFAGWFIDSNVLAREAGVTSPMVYRAWRISLRYVVPVAIIAVIIYSL